MTTEQIARPVRRLYTVPELQEVLRCKRSTAYALVRKGGALHRVWLRALSPVAKLQSIVGTLKRIVKKRILRPERAFDLEAGGEL